MKHSYELPLAPRPIADRWSARPPWADRAIGAAAAAVFLAGIVSARLVESEGGPNAPTLAAPAAAPSTGGPVRTVDSVFVPPVNSPTGSPAFHGGGAKTGSTGSGGDLARSVGSVPAAPAPKVPGSTPTPAPPPPGTVDPPADHGSDSPPVLPTLPIPDNGVTVGPVTVATPDNGATVTINSGVVAPITVSLP